MKSLAEPISFLPKTVMIIFSFCKQVSGLGNSWQTTLRPLGLNLSKSPSLSPKKIIYAFGQWPPHYYVQTNHFILRCFAAFTYFSDRWFYLMAVYLLLSNFTHCLRNISCIYRKQLKETKVQSNLGPFCIQHTSNMKFIFLASTSPLPIQTPKHRKEGSSREKECQAYFLKVKPMYSQLSKTKFFSIICYVI